MFRTILSPQLARVSLDGVDAGNPPTTTSKHLAIDSSWNRAERLLTIGVLHDTNLIARRSVFFDEQQRPPLATLIRSTSAGVIQADEIGLSQTGNSFIVNGLHYISGSFRSRVDCVQDVRYGADPANYNFHVLVFNDGKVR